LWFGAVFFAGWTLFGISMWANLSATLRHERRETLTRRIDRLQQLLADALSTPRGARYNRYVDFAHATGHGLIAVYREDGSLAYPAPSLDAALFPWPHIRRYRDAATHAIFAPVQRDGEPYWIMGRPVSLGGQSLMLMAAAPEAGNVLVMQRFLWGLLASAPLLLLISSAGGYWVSRRALKAVDRITAAARSISIHNISERVPVTRNGDELERLAETCNAMLDRLESSVSQIKRFTADASHELRGPLTFSRTVAEIALRNPNADLESRKALQEIVEEAGKAAVLLEDMLTLARADAVPVSFARTYVELRHLLEDTCETAQPLAAARGLRLNLQSSSEHAIVLGEAGALRRLFWILLDNAIKYSRTGGSIRVSLHSVAGLQTVSVTDDGIGIAPDDLPWIFDRFYRADASRGITEGTGLGLAIARWIAETHEADLRVQSEKGVGSTFTLAFPALPAQNSLELCDDIAPNRRVAVDSTILK
jgi:heavy metal sensor kinase